MRKWLLGFLLVAFIAAILWGSDWITLQGERTVYTVRCDDGVWQGTKCTGRLAAGDRHAFRASRSRNEVVYWIRESKAPSGKYSDCMVKDRDNWTCNVHADQKPAITYEMVHGKPTHTDMKEIMPFHAVPKWEWWLMKAGCWFFHNASN
jgi:hypothetical protein